MKLFEEIEKKLSEKASSIKIETFLDGEFFAIASADEDDIDDGDVRIFVSQNQETVFEGYVKISDLHENRWTILAMKNGWNSK